MLAARARTRLRTLTQIQELETEKAVQASFETGTRTLTQYVLWRRGSLLTLIGFKAVALVCTVALKAVRR